MSKFIVFSDLHAHNYRKFNTDGQRMNYCLKVIEDVFEYAANNEADAILFPGDLYDQQQALPTVVVNKVIATLKKMFKKYQIPFVAISGNHDHATKNTKDSEAISALHHLQDVFEGQFELIDNGIYEFADCLVYGIPYYESPDDFKEMLLLARNHASKQDKPTVLMIHQTPKGIGNEMIVPDTDPADPAYSVFDLVLCGHIHQHKKLNDGFYVVGSPIHRDLGDEGDKKSFMEIELDAINGIRLKRVMTNYPEYIRVEVQLGQEPEPDGYNYIIPVPTVQEVVVDSNTITQSEFGADLAPINLMENYAKKLLSKEEVADYLDAGKKLLVG